MTKKELAEQVYELSEDSDATCKFFCSANAKQTQFMLCVVTSKIMTNEELLQALDVFVGEAIQNELDLLGPGCSNSDH